jgi:hypothetical protein
MRKIITPRPLMAKRLIFAASLLPLSATFSDAAAVNDSYLIASDGKISDATFANIMASALIKGGQPNVLDAAFLFNTCYGGGMIDNLSDKLGTVPWVAASASAATEQSTGQLTVAEANKANASLGPADQYKTNGTSIQVSNTPGDFWTSALIPELGKADQTILQSANNAGNNDPMGANPKAPNFLRTFEHAQSSSANGGDKILLTDPNATTYDAILWAGNPNRARHPNDITGVFNALSAAWKGQNFTINVLYGKGGVSKPTGVPWTPFVANQTTLMNVLGNFKLNNQTEFLFYATDHGSGSKTVKSAKSKVSKNDSDEEDFSLDPVTVSDIDTDEVFAEEDGPPSGFSPYMPYIEIDYDGVADDNTVGVYAGSDFLGYLPSADTVMDFNIPYSDVGTADSITVVNGSSADFNLDGEEFDTGDEAEDAPAPEPAMLSLGTLGAMLMFNGRRRRDRFRIL